MYRIRPSWQIRLSWLVAPAVILGLFAGTLAGADRLAFRDVSHFYAPVYEYVAARSLSDWLPAWNPLDQTGIPLLGETTTAFFYPVRYLVFGLPVPTSVAMGGYVAAHLLLASVAAAIAAGWAGATRRAAAIAGVVYPLSGSLVGLYLNPPFLVGAAWLPLAAGALLGEQPVAAPARALIAGMALALMVLGGDPQTALHVMLIAGAAWLVAAARRVWRSPGRASALGSARELVQRAQAISRWALSPGFHDTESSHDGEKPGASARPLRKTAAPDPNPAGPFAQGPSTNRLATTAPKLSILLAAPLIAAALSIPQLAASMSWSRHSERVEGQGATAWWQPPASGSQRHQAYQFSLPPWHLAGLVTPTPWGTLLPEYRQLSALIPGDGRIWTFSIYPGLLATLTLIGRVASWRRDGLDRWSLIAVTALMLSMGHFGLVWWLQNMTGRFGQLDSAIGGAYWLLYHAVPGYDLFRYPAKWLPMFSLGASIVAAKWCDRFACRVPSSVRWTYGVLLAATAIACGAVALAQQYVGWVAPPDGALPVDRFWGPLDVAGALREIQFSLIHSLAVLLALGAVLFVAAKRRWFSIRLVSRRTAALSGLLALTTVDLTLAARGWIRMVDVNREVELVQQIAPAAQMRRWLRTQSGGGWPRAWRDDTSPRRLMEVEASQRAAWMGRWHLSERQAVLNSMTSIQSHDIASFWRATARITSGMPDQQRDAFWRSVRRWLAVGGESHTTDHVVHVPLDSSSDRPGSAGERPKRLGYDLVDIHRLEDAETASSVRLHRRWHVVPQADDADTSEHWQRLLSDVAQRAESTVPRVTDARSVPVSAPPPGPPEPEPDAADRSGTAIQIADQSPDRLELTVTAGRDSLLTRRVYQDGHWAAWIRPGGSDRWRRSTVYSVDYLAQGIRLSAGRWDVRFVYQPAWLRPAVTCALIAWAACAVGIGALWWRSDRRTDFRLPVRWRS